eukprot:COSAG02_NODE_29114_length_576_cov_0.444444_1_plen_36_part_10
MSMVASKVSASAMFASVFAKGKKYSCNPKALTATNR